MGIRKKIHYIKTFLYYLTLLLPVSESATAPIVYFIQIAREAEVFRFLKVTCKL